MKISKEDYEAAENILLSKEIEYFDWLRMKGTTPRVYQAIIEAMVEFRNKTWSPVENL